MAHYTINAEMHSQRHLRWSLKLSKKKLLKSRSLILVCIEAEFILELECEESQTYWYLPQNACLFNSRSDQVESVLLQISNFQNVVSDQVILFDQIVFALN